ncbi:MAG: GTPase [Granulosicoccus sp.]
MNESNQWVTQLLHRYSNVVANSDSPSAGIQSSLNTLQLADAVLDNSKLLGSFPNQPLQIAVIGPTQSGKSTLVNVLLNAQVAGISALAGFTVHAQGYASQCSEEALANIDAVMHPLQRTLAVELDATKLDSYVLESIQAGEQSNLSPAVVWDTPDFDSIEASTYTLSVLNTVALADVLILMVSKDKYGDKSVWDMLALIEPLGKPLIVCINKLDEHDEQTVKQAFSNRYDSQFPGKKIPNLVLLPFAKKTTTDAPPSFEPSVLSDLTSSLEGATQSIERTQYCRLSDQFIEDHQAQWFAPIIEEQSARTEWQNLIDDAVIKADETYATEYLDNDDKYDTFNRALAELLTLLELPGIAPTLAKTRQLITWPARKFLGVGKSMWNAKDSSRNSTESEPTDLESEALELVLNTTLVSLQGSLLEQPQNAFWTHLNRQFRHNEQAISTAYREQAALAQKDFEPEIEEAAKKLFEQLQSQPALLNSLRAARVTADAAGVALALKSGGLAPADLILAPAMLSVTTLLTESALGRYLETIKQDLKRRQREHINQRVVNGVLGSQLAALAGELDDNQLLAQNLEPELQTAIQAFKARTA